MLDDHKKSEVKITFDVHNKDLNKDDLAALIDTAFKDGKEKLFASINPGLEVSAHEKVTVVSTFEKSQE